MSFDMATFHFIHKFRRTITWSTYPFRYISNASKTIWCKFCRCNVLRKLRSYEKFKNLRISLERIIVSSLESYRGNVKPAIFMVTRWYYKPSIACQCQSTLRVKHENVWLVTTYVVVTKGIKKRFIMCETRRAELILFTLFTEIKVNRKAKTSKTLLKITNQLSTINGNVRESISKSNIIAVVASFHIDIFITH